MRKGWWIVALAALVVGTLGVRAGEEDAGSWETAKMTFRAAGKKADAFPVTTPAATTTPVSASGLPLALAGGIQVGISPSEFKIEVDLNGDGKMDGKAGATGESFNVHLEGEAGASYPYAFRIEKVGASGWGFRRNCMMVGKVAGAPVCLIDDNNNGRYNDVGADAISVGSTDYAVPLGRLVTVKGKIYEIETSADGSQVRSRPHDGPTGTVDLRSDYKPGKALAWAVLKGPNNTYFDVAGGATVVPVGSYSLLVGDVTNGRHGARILNGSMEPLQVSADQTTTKSWGLPLVIDFEYTRSGRTVTVKWQSIKVIGAGGELYSPFRPSPLTPSVIIVDATTGKQVHKGSFCLG